MEHKNHTAPTGYIDLIPGTINMNAPAKARQNKNGGKGVLTGPYRWTALHKEAWVTLNKHGWYKDTLFDFTTIGGAFFVITERSGTTYKLDKLHEVHSTQRGKAQLFLTRSTAYVRKGNNYKDRQCPCYVMPNGQLWFPMPTDAIQVNRPHETVQQTFKFNHLQSVELNDSQPLTIGEEEVSNKSILKPEQELQVGKLYRMPDGRVVILCADGYFHELKK